MIERLLEAERMLSFGQLEHAETIYRQVSDADPKNSIAVVGLARVALERGDELSSYLLARRALGIDPENDAARRLAVRLEEVLRVEIYRRGLHSDSFSKPGLRPRPAAEAPAAVPES